ncbi:GntR family transcriptional regulator [Keratinibaculum paraultunense]|uniref:GntR family transcriptional regulator n=1 Tax=Keratinibaculum paraultunense TaxID=1278232 RepID=A0A4R3L2I7_9FIRM|nr:GntR family transcriptional regulator [Keratinibaculum paraultunense]NLV75398.1 GntR family transcriptional regulator [Tissierellia bacterium]QQY80223.1 GntR family transcriptional regulator [Keratinibaculum paraultunense]TCS90735.1 GntR family transcriptional regulator [Keratinibaculum paraultunense]
MFNVDASSSTPIYQQIVDNVKESILKGLIEPGEKLPSVRELAKILTLNPNTIQKAYQELERQKVIVTLRGKGTYVSSDYKPRRDEYKLMEVKELFKKGIIEAHYMGFKEKDILNIIEELFKELEGVDEND